MESKFNTHGGHFSPKGYLRVDEGGSHEENPNGGVQIGVDPNGVPNMLEENEPVYNDYVFSDNIVADKDILVKHNIPAKYAGKLYSEIADAFVDEAEERPMDSISNNGLNVMLTRLRDAQEEQKQLKEQAEIEEELAGLSPEELAELEVMLGGQQETPMQGMPVEEPVVMDNGGEINRFDDGGDVDGDDIDARIREARQLRKLSMSDSENIRKAEAERARAARALGWRKFVNNVIYFGDDGGYERANDELNTLLENYANGDIPAIPQNIEKAIRSQNEYVNKLKARRDKRAKKLEDAQARLDKANAKLGIIDFDSDIEFNDEPVDSSVVSNPVVKKVDEFELPPITFACGGKMNKHDVGGFNDVVGRYIGPVHNLVAASVNAAQEPNKYDFKRLSPRLVYTRAPEVIDQTFRPIDTNFAVNDILSSSAGTARSLMNSGAGPGVGNLLVAIDKNATGSIGGAREQIANYNNTGRNNVISQRNQNAFQRAQLMYEIARANANAQAGADKINLQTDMSESVMNNREEQAWANAVSAPIDNAVKALSDMYLENRRRKLANNSSVYGYSLDDLLNLLYNSKSRNSSDVNSGALGGLLLKRYKE